MRFVAAQRLTLHSLQQIVQVSIPRLTVPAVVSVTRTHGLAVTLFI